AFVDQGVSLDDANNLTPEVKAMAQEEMKKYRIGPLYTPPSLQGTLMQPNAGGGASWGGASYDPDTGYLFVRAAHSIGAARVGENDGTDPLVEVAYSNMFGRGGRGGARGNAPGRGGAADGRGTAAGGRAGDAPARGAARG